MRIRKNELIVTVLAALAFMPLLAHAKQVPPANRVSLELARTAASKAYGGTVRGEELEFEGGKWIYSFDLKKANDSRVQEVHVDAISGKVLDAHMETLADEKKELKQEANEAGD
jgi:hypothetical protein